MTLTIDQNTELHQILSGLIVESYYAGQEGKQLTLKPSREAKERVLKIIKQIKQSK